MKAKMQSYVLLLSVLLLGVILGILIGGRIFRHRIDRVRGFVNKEEVFIRHLTEDLNLDAQQQEAILPLLKEHFERMKGIHLDYRQVIRGEFQVLIQELEPNLTEPQQQQLRKSLRKMHRKRERKGRPPHRLGPPMDH